MEAACAAAAQGSGSGRPPLGRSAGPRAITGGHGRHAISMARSLRLFPTALSPHSMASVDDSSVFGRYPHLYDTSPSKNPFSQGWNIECAPGMQLFWCHSMKVTCDGVREGVTNQDPAFGFCETHVRLRDGRYSEFLINSILYTLHSVRSVCVESTAMYSSVVFVVRAALDLSRDFLQSASQEDKLFRSQ